MRQLRPIVRRASASVLALAGTLGGGMAASPAASAATGTTRYVVTFTDATVPEALAAAEATDRLEAAAARLDATALVDARPLAGRFALVESRLGVAQLRRLPGVAAVEVDRALTPAAVSAFGQEPGDGAQWALYNTGGRDRTGWVGTPGADVSAPDAWAEATGAGVVVAVADTGTQLDHPDLVDNIWANDGETCGSAVDNDDNGFAGDCHGWDFGSRDADPSPVPLRRLNRDHGTQVAGAVAAARNGVGLSGLAPEAEVMVLKIADENGTLWLSAAAAAMVYAADNGAQVFNASWGGINTTSVALRTAVEHARAEGMLVVAAAGNNGRMLTATTRFFPASYAETYDHVISVAATASNDALATFSNRGAVSISAPGMNVGTAMADGTWKLASGTSFAAPLVAGAAALVLEADPTATPADVRQAILSTADQPSVLQSGGAGRLNAARALGATRAARPTVAAPVVNARAVTTSSTAELVWSLPSFVGIDEVQLVAVGPDGHEAARATLDGDATVGTITGLSPQTDYDVQVRAVQADGVFATAVVPAVTADVVPPPTNVALTGTATHARLQFDRVGTSVTRYLVSANGATREIGVTRTTPATLATVFGPYDPDTEVTATVVAVGVTGELSAPVQATFVTSDASDAPEATVTLGFGSLTIEVAPTDVLPGRLPITAYVVQAGVRTMTVPVTSEGMARATFKNLLGPQDVAVQALHGTRPEPLAGLSTDVGTFTPMPMIRPPMPTGITVTQPTGKIRVTWTSAGPTASSYEVQLGRFPPVRVPAGQLFYEFTNPGKAGSYTLAVRSVNQFGKSQSSVSVRVDQVQPDPVTDLEVTVDDTVLATWAVPTGSWTTYFVVRINGGPGQTVRTPRYEMRLPATGQYTLSVVAMNPFGSSAPVQATFERT